MAPLIPLTTQSFRRAFNQELPLLSEDKTTQIVSLRSLGREIEAETLCAKTDLGALVPQTAATLWPSVHASAFPGTCGS